MVTFASPLPAMVEGETAQLAVGNRYRLDRTDFLFDTQSQTGIALGQAGVAGFDRKDRFQS